MTKNNEQIIIDDLKEMIYKLQIECVEKTNNILALGEKLHSKEQECETLASQLDFEVQKKECLEQECEELKKKIKSYQCNEKNANRCTCAFRCLENTFYNDAENKIDEIQTKIKVLKIFLCKLYKNSFF